jgi:hypothetical protein
MRRVASLLLVLLAASPTWAQTSEREESDEDQAGARALFEQGVAAAQRRDYAAAVEAFERSYELYSHPGTLINLAQYQDELGRRAAAYRSWRELIERFDTVISARSLRQARERVATLEAELATVWIAVSPVGASVQVDGGEVWPTPMSEPIRLAPGPHEFVGRRAGYQDAAVARELQAGVNPDVALTLAPVGTEPEPGVLVVDSATPNASASIDDGPLRPAPIRATLRPGEHRVRVVALGHEEQTRPVTVVAAQETAVSISLERERRRARAAEPPPPPPTPPPRRRRRDRQGSQGFWHGAWPWVIGGLVLAGAGVGLGLGLGLQSDEPPADAGLRFP